MLFKNAKGITIPEGSVKKITAGGVVLWEKPKAFTNLADPTSSDWLVDYRLSTGGVSASSGPIVTNYIPCKKGDVIRVKGLNICQLIAGSDTNTNSRAHWLDANKSVIFSNYPAEPSYGFIVTDGAVYKQAFNWIYTVGKNADGTYLSIADNIAYMRFCGALENTANDVIITVNEPIEDTDIINQIPISTDADGNVYNTTGYKTGYRINSSGVEKESTDYSVTGYIPYAYGDTVYGTADIIANNAGNANVAAYTADHTFIQGVYFNNSGGQITTDDNGVWAFNPVGTSGDANFANAAYIRVTGTTITDASIITRNQPIE